MSIPKRVEPTSFKIKFVFSVASGASPPYLNPLSMISTSSIFPMVVVFAMTSPPVPFKDVTVMVGNLVYPSPPVCKKILFISVDSAVVIVPVSRTIPSVKVP